MSEDNKTIEDNNLEDTISSEQKEAEKENQKEETSIEDLLAIEQDKFLRLFAEFENFKKRTSKERIELYKSANKEVMTAMVPVIDDFDRAISEIKKNDSNTDSELLKGVELIFSKFTSILTQKGLEPVEVNNGDVFDTDIHEAITQIPAPSEDLKGKVVDVIEKGYKLGEKVIRFPKVIVGQ